MKFQVDTSFLSKPKPQRTHMMEPNLFSIPPSLVDLPEKCGDLIIQTMNENNSSGRDCLALARELWSSNFTMGQKKGGKTRDGIYF